jgi:hypothetical protein
MPSLIERAFFEPFRRLTDQLAEVLPVLTTVLIILVIGGAAAYLARVAIFHILTWTKFDRFVDQTGLGSTVIRSQIFRSPSDFAARVVQGFLWVFIILFALNAAGTEVTEGLVARFFNYVPDLIAAALVLLLAQVISKFLARSALLAAVNAQWTAARLVAGGVRVLVMSLGVVAALEQLRIGSTALLIAFAILFAGVVIAAAVAFGLGARDWAKEWLDSKRKPGDKEEEAFRHL